MRFVIYLAVIFILFTTSLAVVAPTFANGGDPNFTKVYETNKGVVTFNHENHVAVFGSCEHCHVERMEGFDGMTKDFAHKVCKSCHREVKSIKPDAPTKCSGCHVK